MDDQIISRLERRLTRLLRESMYAKTRKEIIKIAAEISIVEQRLVQLNEILREEYETQ